ncbi:hypothetical protein BJX76DRAFT_351470 [Aspergillus varians]
MTLQTTLFDALIIGAGPAGLSTATGLARQLHTAVVFDSGVYRNARAEHMHNVLGWDHVNPARLREKGRTDLLARYETVKFRDVPVETVRRVSMGASNTNTSGGNDGGKSVFEAVDAAGKTWYGRKVVLATGVRDLPLGIDGFEECWGRGIFHCLFCDGYESRDQKTAGMLALGAFASISKVLHVLRMALQLAERVTVYTDGNEEFAAELRAELGEMHAVVDTRKIVRLEKGAEGAQVLVHFADSDEKGDGQGSKVEGFLVYGPATEVNGPFAKQLGLDMTAQGDLQVSQPFSETSMPGVFAVGDVAGPLKAVTLAVSSGSLAAGGVAMQVLAEGPLSWGLK